MLLALVDGRSVVRAGETVTEVEKAPEVVEPTALGTHDYEPTEREAKFVKKTPEEERVNGSILDDAPPYVLSDRAGKRVAWFGIVREVTHDKDDGSHVLLLEHKFFDGLTDLHILALSFNGGGDFKARLKLPKDAKPPEVLSLVRVYGEVAKANANETPTVEAEYARVFPWKTFTFLDCYGKDATNPKWRKLCTVDLDRIYDSTPDDRYYEQRLGPRPKGEAK